MRSPELATAAKDLVLIPVGLLDMIALGPNARLVITRFRGVDLRRAFFFSKPCVMLRAETEWVELVRTVKRFSWMPIKEDRGSRRRFHDARQADVRGPVW
ncbi:MAG: hypothetical protein IPP83_15880 [Flavobacteriales bacterium]|nr:hypothetical protein [Flavobacteriales bacterium]